MRGQEAVKRAITVAASGGHNLLMIGPPGTGKTMLAQRMAGVLPPLGRSESLETTRIYSAMGLLPDGVALMDERPVRMPHHSATAQALVGGGTVPRPGEVSLAHHGILFLDELPEFSRYVLETLRQPLENGEVTVARVHGSMKFPARFMLVAAMNPTARGFASENPRARDRYLDKLSGPLLDRIDIHVEVPAVPYPELTGKNRGHGQPDHAAAGAGGAADSAEAIWEFDAQRAHEFESTEILLRIERGVPDSDEAGDERTWAERRAYDKVRRVARTIADLEQVEHLQEHHLAEAIQYRLLDRQH